MKKLPVILLFFVTNTICHAQGNYQYGAMPSLTLLKEFQGGWMANLKLESRQSIYNRELKYDYLLTDISIVFTKRVASNITFGGGYLLRAADDEFRNRTIQQVSIGRRYSGFRMSHRFLTDQTFLKNDETELRLRYRISAEIPLEGESPDINEFYLKCNNEILNSWQGNEYDIELRWVALLGYSISPESDFEVGIDYRSDSFISGNSRNRIWLSINLIYSPGNE